MKSKYIVLQGLKRGNRFYTINNQSDKEIVKLASGEVAYRIIGYAETGDEARLIIANHWKSAGEEDPVKDYIRQLWENSGVGN